MKTFINKIDNYLITKYPNIWNTKIVWMLAISLIIHLLFYGFGFVALTNVNLLHQRDALGLFFENGTIYFSILISIVLLFIWLIKLFKNNAFKNFYPTNRNKLFGQFLMYFIIILASTTFYYSYIFGIKHFINIKYTDTEFINDVKSANNASVFLSHNLFDYSIFKKAYPKPFGDLYCESNTDLIDTSKAYLSFYTKRYQFYTLYSKTILKDSINAFYKTNNDAHVFRDINDSTYVYYYKDKVVNLSEKGYDAIPNYNNYSDWFFKPNGSNYSFTESIYNDDYNNNIKINNETIQRNKAIVELLNSNSNNTNQIKARLTAFLNLCKKFNVAHNLSTNTWFSLVYNSSDFTVKQLIQKQKPANTNYNYEFEEQTALEKHIDAITTNYFIESKHLFYCLENINDIKEKQVLDQSVNVFLWIAFIIAILIFIYRISDLKTFIFSIIAGVILTIFTILLIVLYEYFSIGKIEYMASYTILIIGTLILIIPLIYLQKIKKLIVGICVNLTLAGFAPYLFLIIGIIAMHQKDNCKAKLLTYRECPNILTDIGIHWSYILLILSFVFIYFYTTILKRWRALPNE